MMMAGGLEQAFASEASEESRSTCEKAAAAGQEASSTWFPAEENMDFLMDPTCLLTKHGFETADVLGFLGGCVLTKLAVYGCLVRVCQRWQPCRRFLTRTRPGSALSARMQERHPYFVAWFHAKSQEWALQSIENRARRRERLRRFLPMMVTTSGVFDQEKVQRYEQRINENGGQPREHLDRFRRKTSTANGSAYLHRNFLDERTSATSSDTLENAGQAAVVSAPQREGHVFDNDLQRSRRTVAAAIPQHEEKLHANSKLVEQPGNLGVGMVEAIALFKCLWPFVFPIAMYVNFRLYCTINETRLEKQKIAMAEKLRLEEAEKNRRD
ncbi:unnamed protein product [Amoebophrya sp. A25]|nr:unnamed protein product [Amoebophrya sp. A25]|eukprot:GSA25T00000144001.1